MKQNNHIFFLLLFLILYSCNRSREIEIPSNRNYKFVVSTKYTLEDGIESFYYELRTASNSIIIPKTWFLAISEYKEIELTDFSSGTKDSLIYLKFHKALPPQDSIVVIYNTTYHKKLAFDEINNAFEKK